MSEPAPFFLVGSERSGTTLLRLMLAHHPAIECAPEFEFLVEFMDDGPGFPGVRAYAEWLATNRIFQPHGLAVDASLPYAELCRGFLRQYCQPSRKPVWGATCHMHFDRLLRIWPEARFVHLVRDGRDVARSCIGMGWAGNVWHGAERWIVAEELWEHLQARLPGERRLEVRYEDLIEAPEAELDRIARFVGQRFSASMLAYAENSTYERPDPSLKGQWKRKLRADELALLEARIGPLLRARGYEASGVPAADVSLGRRCALAVQDKVFRVRFRGRRYGYRLLVKLKLARLLGLKELEARLTRVRNEINNRALK